MPPPGENEVGSPGVACKISQVFWGIFLLEINLT